MSKALILFNSWMEDKDIGCFWELQTIPVYTIEEIKDMGYKQLKYLSIKIDDYDYSYKETSQINSLCVDGYKYVRQHLVELETAYYEHILNIKFKTSSLVVNQIKYQCLQDKGQNTTYKNIYKEAKKMVFKKYEKLNLNNYLQLKQITNAINLKQMFKQKEEQLDYIHILTDYERAKYYSELRSQKNPEKEEEKKQQSLIRLKEWGKNNPEKYQHSHDQAMKKYNKKKQDLTTCQTDDELAAKMVRNAINKALKIVYNAERYKLKKLKLKT